MKINNIIIAVSAILVLLIIMGLVGTSVTPFAFLLFGIPIGLFAYLIILAKRYVDAKVQESKASTNLNALKESMDRIEERLDKIESILEKVSECGK
jgi:hypothetical protein